MSERERNAVYAESYRATRAAARDGLMAWKSAMRREFERQNPHANPIFGKIDPYRVNKIELGYTILT